MALSQDAAPQAIARAADMLLADPARREAMSHAARNLYAQRFDLSHTIDALLTPSDW